MKKADAEKGIRYAASKWYRAAGRPEHPSFYAFKQWMREQGHDSYLEFRSTTGADYDAERWFDDEMRGERRP